MRSEKCLLEFKVSLDILGQIEDVIKSLTPGGDDQSYISGAEGLQGLIENKVLEIDMLLSRISHANKVEQGIKPSDEESIDQGLEEIDNVLESIDTEEVVAI